jgi:colicin import membrane protein
MSTADVKDGAAQATSEDPFRFGWRETRQVGPGGTEEWVRSPLTLEDVLHPQEGDFIVQNRAHERDCVPLRGALRTLLASVPGSIVLHDHRTDWEVKGVRAMGPDLGCFSGAQGEGNLREGTFYPARLGARTEMVVEVTSPTTRSIDLGEKVTLYHKAGVPFYYVADWDETGELPRMRLLGYRYTPEGYVPIQPDEMGRLWMEPVRAWLAIEGDRVVVLDARGNRFPDYEETQQEMAESARRAEREVRLRQEAEQTRQSDQAQHRIALAEQRAELLERLVLAETQAKEAEARSREILQRAWEDARRRAEETQQTVQRQLGEMATQLAALQSQLQQTRPQP